ncbi:hypothetical protein [Prevotella sp. E2-28]|uniref:hypothetical protein n=1 Tax=Prevotella sp. E2-28 TaxID=2913620 RepID=UPI001EDC1C8A|nr:hypothetical protein [Prevotella sp. E2-28]UKK52484.1 hypothetical protein L6465_07610 [Prevotella sp. E2-28]
MVKAFRAAFLYRHSSTNGYPAGRLFTGDAQGLVGRDAREPCDILDVRPSVVLVRWRPPTDNRPDGIEPICVVIRACQQHKCCPPAIRHCFKLTELRVCLHGSQALPFILRLFWDFGTGR